MERKKTGEELRKEVEELFPEEKPKPPPRKVRWWEKYLASIFKYFFNFYGTKD